VTLNRQRAPSETGADSGLLIYRIMHFRRGCLGSGNSDMNKSGSSFSPDTSPSQVPRFRTKTHQSTGN